MDECCAGVMCYEGATGTTGKLHHYVTAESSGQGILIVLGGLVSLRMPCLATL